MSSTPPAEQKQTIAAHETEERIKRFLAIASHDLQSPLRHITMYAEMLLDDLETSLDSEQLQGLRTILEKAQTAQKLTKSLMTFAAGTPQVTRADVELGKLVQSVWTELTAEMDAADATISISDLPTICTDAGILSLVLKNVLANALVQRGPVTLHITVESDRRGAEWLIHVSDNGPGIDAAYREKIFDPFWKLPRAGSVPGAGLGLTAARELLAALGGSIELARSDESGSRFTLNLPAA